MMKYKILMLIILSQIWLQMSKTNKIDKYRQAWNKKIKLFEIIVKNSFNFF